MIIKLTDERLLQQVKEGVCRRSELLTVWSDMELLRQLFNRCVIEKESVEARVVQIGDFLGNFGEESMSEGVICV